MTNATIAQTVIKATFVGGQINAKLHAGPKGDQGDQGPPGPGGGSSMVTAITGSNSVGYVPLIGATDGTNNTFAVQEGAFVAGSARPYLGESAVRIGPSQFSTDPANGLVILTFNPTDPIMLDYVPA